MNFKEKLTFYDKINLSDNIINNLNEIGRNIAININFIKRLNYRIYNWYVEGDLCYSNSRKYSPKVFYF